jgi:hypothetical protein
MANLNLSQFTEKTLVADADWVFVWDTAGLISKKVSRNSLLNSGTLATSAPVTISQTWGAVGQTFKAFVVNAAGTSDANSASGSLLLDLQVGGVTKVSVDKIGTIGSFGFVGANVSAGSVMQVASLNANYGYHMARDYCVTWGGGATLNGTIEVSLCRDGAANTLALRNSTAAQTFRVYNTFPGNGNNEFGSLNWVDLANEFQITTGIAGTGTSRALCLRSAANINFRIGGAPGSLAWQVTSAGNFVSGSDNSYDIGATGANRPRNVYAGSAIKAQYFQTNVSSSYLQFGTDAYIGGGGADGVILLSNNASTNFNRLQFGGTTDSFPAIARDGAGIKFTGAAAGLTSHIKVPAVAVTSLPSAATAGVGARAFVNDALAPVFGSTVATGGAVAVPVYSDGSAWKVG